MIWQKNWWETRYSVWTSLGLLTVILGLVVSHVFSDHQWAGKLQQISTEWDEQARRALPALGEPRGQMWVMWFKSGLGLALPYLAMGWGILVPGCSSPWTGMKLDGGRLFMLSLPISRRSILLSQAATACVEIWLLAAATSLLLPIIFYWNGQQFLLKDALIFASLSALGSLLFYFLALLLTVIFDNGLKSFLLTAIVFGATMFPFRAVKPSSRWNPNQLIAGEEYFLHGEIPWLMLGVSLALSGLLLWGAVRIFERRDF